MGCGIIFPRNYNTRGLNPVSKQSKKSHRSNSSDDSEFLNPYSSSDERCDQLSQSSHSGAENDSSFESDENSDYYEDDEQGSDWMIPLPPEIMPMKSRILRYRRNMAALPPPMAIITPPDVERREHKSSNHHNSCKIEVFFTRNGVIIGQKEIFIPKGGFYPTVGMLSTAEKVKVDLHPLTG